MIQKQIGYSYNDVTIIPSEVSEVSSRSECNPFYIDNDLPIFAAPMSSVISEENYQDFIDEGITPIIPRSVPLNNRIELLLSGVWTAVSLQEFIDLFVDEESDYYESIITGLKFKVCVDIANGHMLRLYDLCERAKRESIVRGYEDSSFLLIAKTVRRLLSLSHALAASMKFTPSLPVYWDVSSMAYPGMS